ncbi:hypothetical protein [Microbacterium sp. KR10-403]|uniref:hypothetical protein n=1 Tax=Microbacterium sp. KR10-403 TaxID=3158581 RepID=UPI0032E528C6
MSDQRPTRRDLMKPAQLLGLALIAALFAGVVTLVSMGFFQKRYPGESAHALVVGGIVAGITFVVTVVVIALLLLVVQPDQIAHPVDKPVLVARDEAVEREAAARDAAGRDAAGRDAAARDAAGHDAAGQAGAGQAGAGQAGAGKPDDGGSTEGDSQPGR